MSFEAWHGSKSGYCGFMEGYREVDVAWFSFYRVEAEEFARQAWDEGYLPTLCRVSVEGSRYSLFDANSDLDEDGERDLLECLKRKGVSDGSIPYILSGILNYDFTAFDPDGGGTDSVQVAECIRELGYIGWLERESRNDDPGNFGLFDPARNVTVIEEIKLCPERGTKMSKIDDNTYECGCCDECGIYKTCEFCNLALEFDEDWIYPCNCDLQMRKNSSDQCRWRARDLRDTFEPNEHAMRYDLSGAVANAMESSPRYRPTRRDFEIFGLEDVPVYPDLFQSALQEKIEFGAESREDLEEIAAVMRDHNTFRHFIPPTFGYRDLVYLESPFWFVHFTWGENVRAIADRGFIGREDAESLYSTKRGIQSPLTADGFIFGYLLDAQSASDAEAEILRRFESHEDEDTVYPYYAAHPHYIIAKAEMGIEGYHSMDGERQLIVPIACVDRGSIHIGDVEDYVEDWRENPMTTVTDLGYLIEDSPFHSQYEISDESAFESAQSQYAQSFSDPDGYLEDHPMSAGYRYMYGRNYIFVGPKGRMLKVYAEDLQPIEGNIFYADKLKGLAVAPNFVDFKIPLYVGYVDPWEMDEQMYQEAIDYEDAYYQPDEDDIGEIFFKLRDGNHRTLGALLSGEPYAYVQISNSMNQDYEEWVAAGRPDEWPWASPAVLAYLDENLV